MACRYTYKGKTYEAWEFEDVLKAIPPTEASVFMPGIASIPELPFGQKTEGWLNLALKRIMVMAAEGGYDKVAFVNGEQSADRYDLSKQVDVLSLMPDSNGKYTLDVGLSSGGTQTHPGLDFNGVEGLIGKELATKLVDAVDARRENTAAMRDALKRDDDAEYERLQEAKKGLPSTKLTGLDLKVGGEGMKTFYDSIVPNAVKKLLPKVGGGQMDAVQVPNPSYAPHVAFGIDVGGGTLAAGKPTREAAERELKIIKHNWPNAKIVEIPAALSQPGFDVTPAMQDKVKTTGLPRFSLRSKWSDERIDSLINQYSYLQNGREGDTKAYATFVKPSNFLNATATKEYRKELEKEALLLMSKSLQNNRSLFI